jgi:8-oxo-dGTP diphosphatase
MASIAAQVSSELPRQRLTSGVLMRDEHGRVLLVEPSYRLDWLTPGGSVEARESPAQAAIREVREELGLSFSIGRLLALQWCHGPGEGEGVLHFTYDGGVLDAEAIGRIRLEPGLSSFRFVDETFLSELASPETAARVAAAMRAVDDGSVAELGR